MDQDETWHASRPRYWPHCIRWDPASLPKGAHPQFSAHICCGQMAGWIEVPLDMEVGFGSGDFVLDGDSAPLPKKGAEPPIFDPCLLWPNGCMDQDGTGRRDGPRSRPHCVRWGPSSPPQKGAEPLPLFSAHVYCGQTVVCIRIPLGTEVGLSVGENCVTFDPAPLPIKGTVPQFSAHVRCGQTAGWTKMPLSMEVGLDAGDFVLDRDRALPQKNGTAPVCGHCLLWPNGWMDKDAIWYRSRHRPRPNCVRRGPSSARERGTAAPPPHFSTYVYCGHGHPSQLFLCSCFVTVTVTLCLHYSDFSP